MYESLTWLAKSRETWHVSPLSLNTALMICSIGVIPENTMSHNTDYQTGRCHTTLVKVEKHHTTLMIYSIGVISENTMSHNTDYQTGRCHV